MSRLSADKHCFEASGTVNSMVYILSKTKQERDPVPFATTSVIQEQTRKAIHACPIVRWA
jgi:hypothetical protein